MSDCIEWKGARFKDGYGMMHHDGKTLRAHRYSYCLANGCTMESIKGLFVCHRCDNRICINPKHLFLGTAKDNRDDMVAKGRERHASGEHHGLSKLTLSDVRAIKRALAMGYKKAELARIYQVTQPAIKRIEDGTAWKHVS